MFVSRSQGSEEKERLRHEHQRLQAMQAFCVQLHDSSVTFARLILQASLESDRRSLQILRSDEMASLRLKSKEVRSHGCMHAYFKYMNFIMYRSTYTHIHAYKCIHKFICIIHMKHFIFAD